MKKNWKERMKAIIVLILEAGFCLYLAWVIINGFIICPEGLSQKELIRYLFSCVFLVIIISSLFIFYTLLNATQPLCPPKPSETESARSISVLLHTLGV